MEALVLALVAGHIRGDRVACRPGYAPSKEVTYTADNLSGSPICEPCLEESTAYYGNNLRLAPDYGVQSFQGCRALCRKEKRCAYFTHDSENSWCYLKTAKTAPRSKKGTEKRYTSGPSSDECESDSENEIEDNLKERVSLKESDTPEKEEEKKEEEALIERERTAKETKVDSSAKNATASETKSEIEKETKTDETKKVPGTNTISLSRGWVTHSVERPARHFWDANKKCDKGEWTAGSPDFIAVFCSTKRSIETLAP